MDTTSEGLGEMFEGDFADTCANKFPLVLMGAEQRVERAQTQERGPPSVAAEITNILLIFSTFFFFQKSKIQYSNFKLYL